MYTQTCLHFDCSLDSGTKPSTMIFTSQNSFCLLKVLPYNSSKCKYIYDIFSYRKQFRMKFFDTGL